MDLRFDLKAGGPFAPPTMHRMPVHGYPKPGHDYNRAQVEHMRHEMAETPDGERMEPVKKKGRFF